MPPTPISRILFLSIISRFCALETDYSLESYAIQTRDIITRSTVSLGFIRSRFQLHWEPKLEHEFLLELHHITFAGRRFLQGNHSLFLRQNRALTPFDLRLEKSLNDGIYQDLNLFRAHYQQSSRDQTWTVGLQRIAMGVGRIWNPLDVVHPIDPSSLQPALRSPVLGLRWEYYPSSLSKVQFFSSAGEAWNANTSGIQYQWFQGRWEQGISIIVTPFLEVHGYQIEGNLGNSGIEARSEIGLFDHKNRGETDFKGILGIDYGFPNAANLAIEYFFNHLGAQSTEHRLEELQSKGSLTFTGKSYFGISGTYPLSSSKMIKSMLIANIPDHSRFLSMEWSHRGDESMEWGIGIHATQGPQFSEFGSKSNTLYLRYVMYF